MHRFNRRDFIICNLFGGVAVLLSSREALAAAHRRNKKILTAEEWMNRWMAVDRAPGGMLEVSRFKEPIYFLTKPISWSPNQGQGQYEKVEVPVGFVTDFASIPRVFWSLLPTDGEYAYAAVIHDYLYWTQTRPRNVADEIFQMAMQDFHINAATIQIIYRAVRIGGDSAWSDNAKLKAAGERRILKVYPTDPTTSWNDWKMRPDVFATITAPSGSTKLARL